MYKQQAPFTSAITLAQQLVGQGAGGERAADGGSDGGPTAVSDGGSGSGGYRQKAVDTYVHLVYGLSKDWCASGLRVGLLYSRNARLQQVGRWRPEQGGARCALVKPAGGGLLPGAVDASRGCQQRRHGRIVLPAFYVKCTACGPPATP